MENKTVLSIHAHPDDTELFCSGTLKLLKDMGFRVVIAAMTGGGLGGFGMSLPQTIITRKEEGKRAADVLGAEFYCMDQPDGFVFDNQEIRLKLIDFIRKINPGTVFTHLTNDYHSDHRTTAGIVEAAAMLVTLPNVSGGEAPMKETPRLYHTCTMSSTDPLGFDLPEPHFYIDVTSAMDVKRKMLSMHRSQVEVMRVMHKITDFDGEMTAQNAELGRRAGVAYAEAFWQHLGGGYQKDPVIQETLKEYILRCN